MAFAGLSPAELLTKFCRVYAQFVQTLAEVFPECAKTRQESERAQTLCSAPEEIQEAEMHAWNSAMKRQWQGATYYKHVQSRNAAIFQRGSDLAFVSKMDMLPKWNDGDFNADSREALWMYLDELNKTARFYFIIPKHLLSVMTPVFAKHVSMDGGHFALTPDFNIATLQREVTEAMGGEAALSSDEMQNMVSTLMDLFQDIMGSNMERLPQLLSMVGLNNVDPAMVGGLLAQAQAFMGNAGGAPGAPGGGLDVSALLQALPPDLMAQMLSQYSAPGNN